MYLLENDLKFPKDNFKCMKYMPYKLKRSFSLYRIKEWYDYWDGNVYVAFSGGLDSTILSHIVCEAYLRYQLSEPIYLVYSDTGTEFPEIREFVKEYTSWLQKKFRNLQIKLEIIRPQGRNFKKVCEEEGFPIISKENAAKIRKLRHGNLSDRYRNYLLNGDERGKFGMLAKKWQYLVNTDTIKEDISEKCCDRLKKEPFKRYQKKTDRYPFIGITQDESFKRENLYNHTGCNVYDGNTPKSQPLGFWLRDDILQYQQQHNIPICSVYGDVIKDQHGKYQTTGEQRTGCVLCGFGCHKESEPNHLQRLTVSPNITHRKMYEWGMKITNNGVTYQEALEHCNIPTQTWESVGQMQLNLGKE